MGAGDLRHRITLHPPGAASKDADGFNTTAPGVPITIWAAKRTLHGSEGAEAGRTTGKQTDIFTIRYRPGVSNHWALTYAGTAYNILYCDDIKGRHEWLEIAAEAVR